ncbi:hypothetical protein BZG02_03125 [Labilibaculum filiforme]|uniref:Uncharacterized protein n=1 Tax=Labilibaculum filiforme TaxID=1940526 RepID=A0A2N3I3I6_9BACT|nr:hypothetical protein BZG02_03125 [Labilibaculum filiforme]
MLEHQKFVLKSVSGQDHLFRKELLKSLNWLNGSEQIELFNWLKSNSYFSNEDCVKEVFNHLFFKIGA